MNVQWRYLIYLLLFVLTLFLCQNVFAANHYIRPGATGNNDGTDWTNAFTTHPGLRDWIRGDTYYYADGEIDGQMRIHTDPSGVDSIIVKKATIADHGTETGWDNSYGDGVFYFTDTTVNDNEWIVRISTDYVRFDGNTGGGPDNWRSGFGFKIYLADSTNVDNFSLLAVDADDPQTGVVIQHIEMQQAGMHNWEPVNEGYENNQHCLYMVEGDGIDSVTVRNCWLHDCSGSNIMMYWVSNSTIEYNCIERRGEAGVAPDVIHGQAISAAYGGSPANNTIRYNLIADICGTGMVSMHNSTQSHYYIYGNIFYHSDKDYYFSTSGVVGYGSYNNTHMKIYNNTFAHMGDGRSNGSGSIEFDSPDSTGNVAYNNLFYNCDDATIRGCVDSLNSFYDCEYMWNYAFSADSDTIRGTDPFTDSENFDFSLAVATDVGIDLGSPYNVDMNGTTRGTIGVLDRGALEYSGTDTDWYVDATGGDDDNAGTSTGAPLQTIAAAVDSAETYDDIFLKRGEEWREQLTVGVSGSSLNYVTITSYGSGADPIITGVDTLSGWSASGNWVDHGSNKWAFGKAEDPLRMWFDDTEELEANGTHSDVSASIDSVDADEPWWYDATDDSLYVYATENPSSAYTSIKAAQANIEFVVTLTGDYIKLINIDIRGGECGIALADCQNVTIDSCTIYESGSHGIRMFGSASTVDSCTVSNSTIDYNYNNWDKNHLEVFADGVFIGHDSNYNEVYNCTITDWTHAGVNVENYTGGETANYNKIYNNTIKAPNTNYCRGFAVTGSATGECAYNEFYNNVIDSTTVRNQVHGDHNKVYYNIISNVLDNPNYGDPWLPQGIAMFSNTIYNSCCHDNEIYNNVLYNIADDGISIADGAEGNKEDNIFKNNIIHTVGPADYCIKLEEMGNGTIKNNTFSNNILWRNGASQDSVVDYRGTAVSISTFNAQSDSGDVISGNLGGNPAFNDSSTLDFSLRYGSIGIDAGLDVSLTSDFNGSTVPLNSTPDIGAYERTVGDFYVDATNGDDSNSGEQSYPWETVAQVNGWTFSAGDSIFFKDDETWREQLTVPNSGSDGSNIVFTNYGGGTNNPIISGADVASGSQTWIPYDDSTWAASHTYIKINSSDEIEAVAKGDSIWYRQSAVADVDDTYEYWTDTDSIIVYTGVGNIPVYYDPLSNRQAFDSWTEDGSCTVDTNVMVSSITGDTVVDELRNNGNDDGRYKVVDFGHNIIGKTVTFSVYMKAESNHNARLQIQEWSGAYPVTTETASVTTDWQRFEVTRSLTQVGTDIKVEVRPSTWGVMDSVYVDCAQIDFATTAETYRSSGSSNYALELTSRDYAIISNGKDYLTIDNIDCRNADTNISIVNEADHVTVQNCTIPNAGDWGIFVWNAGSTDTYCVIKDNTVTNSHHSSISIASSDSNYIENNTTSYSTTGSGAGNGAGISIDGANKNIVSGNTTHDGEAWGVNVTGSGAFDNVIENNTAYNNYTDFNVDLAGHDNIFRYNLSYNSVIGYRVERANSKDNLIYYNVAYGHSWSGIQFSVNAGEDSLNRNLVYNNTIYDCNRNFNIVDLDACEGNLIYNNISIGDDYVLYVDSDGAGDVDFSHNCFGDESSNFIYYDDGNKSTYDAWESAYGGTTNSVEADPAFTDTTYAGGYDFTLLTTSPAINAGVDVGLITDYAGNTAPMPVGSNPDIGAYEDQTVYLTLLVPDGGESWSAGADGSITWNSADIDSIKVEYSTDSGSAWNDVIVSTDATTGSYLWTIPNAAAGSNTIIKVTDHENSALTDQSDAVFRIMSLIHTRNGFYLKPGWIR